MDSSFFVISNNANSTSNINNDLEQSSSSSSLNYDPFEGFSFLDQQGMRLYDYFGCSGVGGGGGGGGRNSPLINQCPLDQLDLQQHKNFLFQTDPNPEDDDDLQGALTGFVDDLGVDSDAGYTSGVDLFAATNNMVDCSESTEAYYLRLALEQNSCNINGFTSASSSSSSCSTSSSIISNNIINYSDTNNNTNTNYDNNNINNNNNNNNNMNYDCNSYNSCNGDSNTGQKAKRSVLMNLLIDGSDVGAGYTSHNCRALPQKLVQRHHQPHHPHPHHHQHHHHQYQQQ